MTNVAPLTAVEACALGRRYLDAAVTASGFQSQVSLTDDMSAVVNDPEPLFGPRPSMPTELFTSLVVYDLVYAGTAPSPTAGLLLDLVQRHRRPAGHFDFFIEEGLLPTDADCTAFGSSVVAAQSGGQDERLATTVERLVNNVDDTGVIEVYLPPAGARRYVDAAVCANVLEFLYRLRCQGRAVATIGHVAGALRSGSHLDGTRYYPSAEALPFFVARLVRSSPDAAADLREPLADAMDAPRPAPRSAMDTAMRLYTSATLGHATDQQVDAVVKAQRPDGSWPPHALYRFGRRHGFFGSTALATAIAVAALSPPR